MFECSDALAAILLCVERIRCKCVRKRCNERHPLITAKPPLLTRAPLKGRVLKRIAFHLRRKALLTLILLWGLLRSLEAARRALVQPPSFPAVNLCCELLFLCLRSFILFSSLSLHRRAASDDRHPQLLYNSRTLNS